MKELLIIFAMLVVTAAKSGEVEKLSPPTIVAIYTTSVYVRIISDLPHREYTLTIYESDGVTVKETKNASSAIVSFTGLSEGTKYGISSAIRKLQKGAVTESLQSDVLKIRTERTPTRLLVVMFDQNYDSDLSNRSSPAFSTMNNLFRSRMFTNFPNTIISLIVLEFFSGSVEGLIEIEKNVSSTTTMAGTFITNGMVWESVLSATSPPSKFRLHSPTVDGFTAWWDVVPDGTKYILEVQCGSDTMTHYLKATSHYVTGVTANTACGATVRAIVGKQVTATSEVKTIRTLASGPPITVAASGASSIRIEVGVVHGAEKYQISLNDTASTTATIEAAEMFNNELTKDLFGLTPGTTLLVTVQAEVGGVKGIASSAVVMLGRVTVTGLTLFNITKNGFDVVFVEVQLHGGIPVSYVVKYVTGTDENSIETSKTAVHIQSTPLETPYEVSVAYEGSNNSRSEFSPALSTEVYTITAVTSHTIQLSWEAVPYEEDEIYASFITNAATSQTKNLPSLTRTFTNLAAGTEYELAVIIYLTAKRASVTYFKMSQITLPGKVQNLKCYPGTKNCISFTWNATYSATSYTLNIRQGNIHDVTLEVDTNKTSVTICDVITGKLYKGSVSAKNSAGTGLDNEVTNCHSVLPAPTNIKITVRNQTCFSITWNAISSVISYTAQLKSDNANLLTAITSFNSTLICGLKFDTTYTALVRAKYPAGDSSFSDELATQITAPGPVQNLQCTPTTPTCFSLEWDAIDSATSYQPSLHHNDTSNIIISVEISKPGAIICGVITGDLYNVSMSATNSGGTGKTTTIWNCYSVLPSPTNVKITVDNQTCFTITWNDVSTATSYIARLESDTANTMFAASATNSTQICGLEGATTYQASVKAIYIAAESPFSTERVSQKTAAIICYYCENCHAVHRTNTSIISCNGDNPDGMHESVGVCYTVKEIHGDQSVVRRGCGWSTGSFCFGLAYEQPSARTCVCHTDLCNDEVFEELRATPTFSALKATDINDEAIKSNMTSTASVATVYSYFIFIYLLLAFHSVNFMMK